MFGWVSKQRHEREIAEYREAFWTALDRNHELAAKITELTQPRDAKGHFVSRKAAVMDEIQDRDCSFIERNG